MDLINVSAKVEGRSFTRSWDNSGYLKKNFWQSLYTPFKVTQGLDFGTNRKRAYDFLLVRNSNLGPILHRIGDIAGFFALPSDPTPIPPQFWGCSRCIISPMLGSALTQALMLFGREIIFQEFQLMWSRYLSVTDGQTDGQTICDRNTALCTKVHRAVKTRKREQNVNDRLAHNGDHQYKIMCGYGIGASYHHHIIMYISEALVQKH